MKQFSFFILSFIFIINCYSQNSWVKRDFVIELPDYKRKIGMKKITTTLVNKKDSILTSKKFIDKDGNSFLYIEYQEDSILCKIDYKIEGDRLKEFKKEFYGVKTYESGQFFFYDSNNVTKIIKWDFKKDTTVYQYYYQTNWTLPYKMKVVKNINSISYRYYSYNYKNQLIGVYNEKNELLLSLEYDEKFNLVEELDSEKKKIKSYKYDELNNLIEFNYHDGLGGVYLSRKFKYDNKNRLIEIIEYDKNKVFKIFKFLYCKNDKITHVFYKKNRKNPDEVYFEKYEFW